MAHDVTSRPAILERWRCRWEIWLRWADDALLRQNIEPVGCKSSSIHARACKWHTHTTLLQILNGKNGKWLPDFIERLKASAWHLLYLPLLPFTHARSESINADSLELQLLTARKKEWLPATADSLPDNCETHCVSGNRTHDLPIVSTTRYQLCHRDHNDLIWKTTYGGPCLGSPIPRTPAMDSRNATTFMWKLKSNQGWLIDRVCCAAESGFSRS